MKPFQEDPEVIIHWKPWIMPEGATAPKKPEGYKDGAKAYLAKLLEDTGLEIVPPSETRDTFLAHVGGQFASEQGLFESYHQRIFEAVWKYDENIEQPKVLQTIAAEVGLNEIDFEQALEDTKYHEKVKSFFSLADEMDIWTIPSYVGRNGEVQVHHFKDIPSVDTLKKIV